MKNKKPSPLIGEPIHLTAEMIEEARKTWEKNHNADAEFRSWIERMRKEMLEMVLKKFATGPEPVEKCPPHKFDEGLKCSKCGVQVHAK